jgi:hypothetical protein
MAATGLVASAAEVPTEAPTAARPVRALGLPNGSVRALLALMVVAVVLRETLAGRPIGVLLAEALLVILAHYFASRRLLALPPGLRERLEQEGVLEPEPSPLWLPRHTVRGLIVAGFFGTAVILGLQGRLFAPGAFENIGLFVAYLAGVLYAWWRDRRRRARPPGVLHALSVHLGALAALIACAILLFGSDGGDATASAGWTEKLLLGIVLFYFGAR